MHGSGHTADRVPVSRIWSRCHEASRVTPRSRCRTGWPDPAPSRVAPSIRRHDRGPWRVRYRAHARGEIVSTHPDHILRVGSQHLAELRRKAAEFERQLWDAHESLEQEMAQTAVIPATAPDGEQEA